MPLHVSSSKRALRRVVILSLVASAQLVPLSSSSACASGHINLLLSGFPPEANPDAQPFYAVAEDQLGTSFRVQRRSDDCSFTSAAADYAAVDGTATNGGDFHLPPGRTQPMDDPNPKHSGGEPSYRDISVQVVNDVLTESGVEHTEIRLSNPSPGATLAWPSAAPLYIIDDDGIGSRLSLLPTYTQSETHADVRVPLFRAGPAAGAATVSYSVGPGGPSPAQAGDFGGSTTGTVAFGPADRVEVIRFSIVNDGEPEPPETLQISLSGPTGAAVEQGMTTFTIQDNEEGEPPRSRLHHPRHRKTYPADDYRIREIHVFTEDPGGSGVVGAQLALRSTAANGRCAWLRGQRFRAGKCSREAWNRMGVYEPGYFYYYRLRRSLALSVGTIKSYTAYARATDGAGNVERGRKGLTRNTFEISQPRKR